jgi:hypothetical protein
MPQLIAEGVLASRSFVHCPVNVMGIEVPTKHCRTFQHIQVTSLAKLGITIAKLRSTTS